MLPKTRKELREVFSSLEQIAHQDDILPFEQMSIQRALIYLLRADYYVYHTGKCHSQLFEIFHSVFEDGYGSKI